MFNFNFPVCAIKCFFFCCSRGQTGSVFHTELLFFSMTVPSHSESHKFIGHFLIVVFVYNNSVSSMVAARVVQRLALMLHSMKTLSWTRSPDQGLSAFVALFFGYSVFLPQVGFIDDSKLPTGVKVSVSQAIDWRAAASLCDS